MKIEICTPAEQDTQKTWYVMLKNTTFDNDNIALIGSFNKDDLNNESSDENCFTICELRRNHPSDTFSLHTWSWILSKRRINVVSNN